MSSDIGIYTYNNSIDDEDTDIQPTGSMNTNRFKKRY